MRKEYVLPGIATLSGIAGFALRHWELSTAFEPDTGLPISGMPATWVLLLLTIAVTAVLAFLCKGLHGGAPSDYDHAFQAQDSTLYIILMTASAFLMAASGILGILSWVRHEVSAFTRLLLGFFCLASAACVFLTGKNNFKREGRGRYSAFLLVPSYTCCLWLISAYQARSADPVILDYVYELFAIIAAVLGTYFMAGFAFERAKAFRSSFFSMMAVYFILVTMADAHDLSILLMYAAFLLYLGASTLALLQNTENPKGSRMRGGRRLLPNQPQMNREDTSDEG